MSDIFERRDGEMVRGTVAEVMASPAPVWDRMPGERARAHEAAREYFKMGANRSQAAVARTLNKEVSQMQRWSTRWEWVSRAKGYDDHLAGLEQKAIEKQAIESTAKWSRRAEDHREKKYLTGEKLENKGAQMLAYPLAAITTDGGKTTVQPGRWKFADAPALIAAGCKMKEQAMQEVVGKDDGRCEEEWIAVESTGPHEYSPGVDRQTVEGEIPGDVRGREDDTSG